jgi:hypothetical protein
MATRLTAGQTGLQLCSEAVLADPLIPVVRVSRWRRWSASVVGVDGVTLGRDPAARPTSVAHAM